MEKEIGSVNNNRDACLEVKFANGKSAEFVIDTGFNGSICLPKNLLANFELEIAGYEEIFGIGTHIEILDFAIAEIIWFGEKREVFVVINEGNDLLIGNQLLEDKILLINYQNKEVIVSQ